MEKKVSKRTKFLCDVEDRLKLGRDKANLIIGILTFSNTLLLLGVPLGVMEILIIIVVGSLALIIFGAILHSSGYAGASYNIIIERTPFFQEMLDNQKRILNKMDLL